MRSHGTKARIASSVRASYRAAGRAPRHAGRRGLGRRGATTSARPRPRAACSRCTGARFRSGPRPPLATSTLLTREPGRTVARPRARAGDRDRRSRRRDHRVRDRRRRRVRSSEALHEFARRTRAAAAPHDDVHRHHGGRRARRCSRALPGARGQGLVRHPAHAPARQGVAVPPQHRAHHRVRRLGEPDLDRARQRPRVDGQGLRRATCRTSSTSSRAPSRRCGTIPSSSRIDPTTRRSRARLRAALSRGRERAQTPAGRSSSRSAPFPFQQEILDKLGRRAHASTAATATSSSPPPAPARR